MTKVVLYDFQSERIKTNVFAEFEENGDLRIDGCDAGELVKKLWDDYDYEYIITVENAHVSYVCNVLGTKRDDLLNSLYDRFAGERAFSRIKKLLEEKGIPFDFFTWA